jgi:hypothetical protein
MAVKSRTSRNTIMLNHILQYCYYWIKQKSGWLMFAIMSVFLEKMPNYSAL